MEGIQAQTGLPIDHQELFFDNLPYCPTEPVTASQLPITTVSMCVAGSVGVWEVLIQ